MSDIALKLRRFAETGRSLDRVWVTIVAILLALAVVVPAQLPGSLVFTGQQLASVAPFLLLSVMIAAWAGATGADSLIARAFSGHPVKMVLMASAFGALSPFCSCGVIPLIAALLSMGVPLAPVMAFWLASPVIDPAMFMLTVGTIGMEFAVGKLLAAIALGLIGGFATLWLTRLGFLTEPLREGIGNGGCGGGKMRSPKSPVWRFWHDPDRTDRFRRDAIKTTLFLGKWLALAFLLESLMVTYIPAETVSAAVGGDGVLPVLIATLVGVPAYLNGYAALPLVGGLIGQGMQAGAGMAFLVAGGVSSLPAAIAVFALVKKPVFALYLAYALIGSFAVGLVFQIVH
ncbi:permease [Thalassospira lucentensis]|uniref:Permease n=1 Tax=Thalassospira lucentensis TaxID=168935 RepID=A0A358HTZ7_9PROT|nr:permease [Thalassospira lucentensis]HBU98657.1 permease [Thalassospira lucentensis]HCW68429.1 permease [Thalassospira lucentensis]